MQKHDIDPQTNYALKLRVRCYCFNNLLFYAIGNFPHVWNVNISRQFPTVERSCLNCVLL